MAKRRMENTDVKEILEAAQRTGALAFGEFKLTSGRTSTYYFDGRKLTLDPEGLYLVARALLPLVLRAGAEAIAGPTLGADPIVPAVAMLSHIDGNPVPGLIVRKELKEHGMNQMIEGSLSKGALVAVVDDSCTTGGSLFHAVKVIEDAGCEVVKVRCVLDRGEGGSKELRKRGYDFTTLLEADADGNIFPAPRYET